MPKKIVYRGATKKGGRVFVKTGPGVIKTPAKGLSTTMFSGVQLSNKSQR